MSSRILFISAFPPSNRTAGQNYTSQLLYDLSSTYDIDLIYWQFPDCELKIPSSVNVLKTIGISKFSKLCNALIFFFFFPLFTVRFNLSVYRMIRAIASEYDIIYFDFSQVFLYSLFIKHPRKVFMSHDVISQKYSRKRLAPIFLWFVKMTESVLLKTADLIMCFSEKDVQYIKNEFDLNARSVSFYISDSIREIQLDKIQINEYFVLFGAWNRPENYEGLIWFCDSVLPYCDIKCLVVGGGMPPEVKSRIQSDKIILTGFVQNPYPLIASATCLLAPLFQGAGVKVKVIEALASGTPVIGTDIAVEGVPDLVGAGGRRALTIANDHLEFINAICNFIPFTCDDKKDLQMAFDKDYNTSTFRNILTDLG